MFNSLKYKKSISVLRKVFIASVGVSTIGSLSLKLVFRTIGIPLIDSNVLIKLYIKASTAGGWTAGSTNRIYLHAQRVKGTVL